LCWVEKLREWNDRKSIHIKSGLIKRYLITTADERSWVFDRPVLFLGDWCRLNHREHIWSGMNAIVAKPYGLGSGQKARDSESVQKITREILPVLAKALNQFHQTGHSERYWNIIIGHWLQRYVAVAFNRYHALEQALQMHDISATAVLRTHGFSLAKANILDFILVCDDDSWNHALYSRILAFRGDVPLDQISICMSRSDQESDGRKKPAYISRPHNRIKWWLRENISRICQKFSHYTDAFIINSALPLWEEIKLQIVLGQVPQIWRKISFDPTPPNDVARGELRLDFKDYTGFERYVRWQLPEVIPTSYLEGYKDLTKVAESLPWPKKPKFILTSVNFSTDEVFKVWAGSKVEQGIPYFTAQHGGNYATHVYYGNSAFPERSSSDKFFTWGWSDGSGNTIPAFNFKLAASKKAGFDPEGRLLLIEFDYFHRIVPWDTDHGHLSYIKDQFCFFDGLSDSIQRQVTVRLKLGERIQSDQQIWRDRYPHARIEIGVAPIRTLIQNSRLIVHSYDSTGILETLALNIPTMCFWRDGLDHLLPEAKPYYKLLRDVGIFTDNPVHAAELIAVYWDNIDAWWLSQKVQDARKVFCARFSREVDNPVWTMKQLLTVHEKSL